MNTFYNLIQCCVSGCVVVMVVEKSAYKGQVNSKYVYVYRLLITQGGNGYTSDLTASLIYLYDQPHVSISLNLVVFSPSLYGATYSDVMFTAVFISFFWLLIHVFRSPFVKVYYLFIYI